MDNKQSQSLKTRAENLFLRSKDEVSGDKEEIVEKLKDKIAIIKETNNVEVLFKNSSPQVKIPLYLIGKFVGHKVLGIIDDMSADTAELSNSLNIPPKGLSRPIGMLTNQGLIEKAGKGFKIRAFKIIDFLDSLSEEQNTASSKPRRKTGAGTGNVRKSKNAQKIKDNVEAPLQYKGFDELCAFLGISEDKLKKILFVRENDVKLIDSKFVKSASTKEIQLDISLALLLVYKYVFELEKFPAALLRKKLQLLGIKSLTNLTTNLHNYPEYIIHDAGKIGSIDNYFLVTQPGENRIKNLIKGYLEGKND